MDLNSLMSASEAGVVLGVLLEGTEYVPPIHKRWPSLKKIGFAILVLSLVADWRFQSAINEEQTRLLLAADNRIASLQTKLIQVAPRAELLYGESRKKLVGRLKESRFASQKVETRFCDASFNRSYIDTETMAFAMLLPSIMQEAGWTADLANRREGCNGTGIWVQVAPNASAQTREAATALADALKALPVGANRTADLTSAEGLPTDSETVVVTVEAHPI
jgi:hypothetical protein